MVVTEYDNKYIYIYKKEYINGNISLIRSFQYNLKHKIILKFKNLIVFFLYSLKIIYHEEEKEKKRRK